MNFVELSSAVSKPGRLTEWAETICYNKPLSAEDKEISEAVDAWLKEVVGRRGDTQHEIAALIEKALTRDVLSLPTAVLDAMFDAGTTIGEFDDVRFEVEPKNTIKVYDGITLGGNVNRSYFDFTALNPTYINLQAETEIKMSDIRRGGYRTIATAIDHIRTAFEEKKFASILSAVDQAITSGTDGYISEATSLPTNASANQLALYLLDHATDNGTSIAFSSYKYIQALAGLTGATTYMSESVKDWYTQNGLLRNYAGMDLYGYSTTKTLGDGTLVVPTKRVFGIAGKIGQMVTRGEARVLQTEDIDREIVHLKAVDMTFGYAITDITKVAKIVMAQ